MADSQGVSWVLLDSRDQGLISWGVPTHTVTLTGGSDNNDVKVDVEGDCRVQGKDNLKLQIVSGLVLIESRVSGDCPHIGGVRLGHGDPCDGVVILVCNRVSSRST